jgi:predicted ATPase
VLASVLGREFPRDVLEALAGGDGERLLDGLDEAVAAGLLAEVPGAPERMRFAHVLFRDTLYEGLTRARRMRLHGQVAAALGRLPGGPDAARLAALARHAKAAGDHAEAIRAAREAAAPRARCARLRRGRPARRSRDRGARPAAAAARPGGGPRATTGSSRCWRRR